jgi:sulfur-oxidizing protein SoxZ
MSALPSQPRIRIPRSARAGEVIEIRTLIEHPMETGLRREAGRALPRDMLTRLMVRLNGEALFAADFQNGTATNPYHVFFVRIEKSSHFEFIWTDEKGRQARTEARVAVA